MEESGLIVEFHGVRGSVASPGPHTAGVGGNTSCVEVLAGQTQLILDAGTGLRRVGDRLMRRGSPVDSTLLLSHLHWDHIQGIPFFSPLYVPGTQVRIISGPNGCLSLQEAMKKQMCSPYFPVSFDDVPATIEIRELQPGRPFTVGEATVQMAKLNHPDPVYAYRIAWEGRSVVYATDTEHFSCVDPHLRALAEGADVLIYDAQYLPEEYSGEVGMSRVGWGHSTFEAATSLAAAAGVSQLILFHHDPQRCDEAVADIERRAREHFVATTAAREGLRIVLDPIPQTRVAAAC